MFALISVSVVLLVSASGAYASPEASGSGDDTSVTKLHSSGGTFTTTLWGYSWRRMLLVVPPHSAIDLVAQVENTASDDVTVNCRDQMAAMFVSTTPPPVLPESGKGDVSSGSAPLFNVLFDTSVLCSSVPDYRKSIKDTDTTHWYLLVQTLGNTEPSTTASGTTPLTKIPEKSQCTVTLHYAVTPAGSRTIELIFVTAMSLVFLTVSYVKLFRRISLQTERDPGLRRLIFVAIPMFLRACIVNLVVVCSEFHEGRRRTQYQKSRAAQMQRNPEEGEAHTAGPAASGDAEAEAEGECEAVCRICRETAENEKLVTPCKCTGSLAYVHESCLDQWRITAQGQNKDFVNSCELCLSPFTQSISFKAHCKSATNLALPLAIGHLLCVLITFVARWTVAEAECMASYNHVKPLPFYAYVFPTLGFSLYCIVVVCVDFGLQLTWDDYSTPPGRRTRILSTIRYVVWLLACPWAAGYLGQALAYVASTSTVWNWEWSLGLGSTILLLMGVVHIVASIVTSTRQERRRRALTTTESDQSTMEDSSPLHGNESVSMASLSTTSDGSGGEESA